MIAFLKKTAGNDTTDAEIISGLLTGGINRAQYERKLYKAYFYFINQGVQKYRLSRDDAASAYSDTIITVIENVVTSRFEGRSSLKSFCYQIFMNKCVDQVRKNTTNKNTVHHATDIEGYQGMLPDNTRNVLQVLIDKNRKTALLQKLNEIGAKCKELLLLYEDGYSDREIAEIMEYNTADVVKTSRLRCIEKLKQKVFGSNEL